MAGSDRNGYMLGGSRRGRGYDWWWHSLVGVHAQTGEKRPFFIEYYIINPALGGDKPVFGQLPAGQGAAIKPAYAMLKAGAWGKDVAVQIHNFYGIDEFAADVNQMNVRIGPHTATETHLKGAVELSTADAQAHPEYMSEAGIMSWDLRAEKVLTYGVGPGASRPMRAVKAFAMFWHVQGMLTRYEGEIIFNGETYIVSPETSAGYQDKNWGRDYTNPWVWLNCNNFSDHKTGRQLTRTSLDVGGGTPVLFGFRLPRKLLIAFYHEGELYEFNFSKLHTQPWQQFNVTLDDTAMRWEIIATTRRAKIEIDFSCPRDHMLLVNYENPAGRKNHDQLWNGGHASGIVNLYHRRGRDYALIDSFDGELGGCEYGEY
ncbi:tocopherol cyclase family protein [Candidatus Bipolaricaulota bacterium]